MFKNKKKSEDGIWEITPKDLQEQLSQHRDALLVIDVRRPDEFKGELGHIEGAQLCTLETELMNAFKSWDSEEEIVFVCRSGGRSGKATLIAQGKGFKNVYNLQGGMMLWNDLGLPTQT